VKSHNISLSVGRSRVSWCRVALRYNLLMTKDGQCPSDRECNNGGERLEYNSDIYFNVIVL